jgi:hypothetical protein
MLCTMLECFRQSWSTFVRGWNAFYSGGMLSRGLECFLEGWNALDRVGMLSRGLECFLEVWNAFDRVGIPLYRVEMLPTVLE